MTAWDSFRFSPVPYRIGDWSFELRGDEIADIRRGGEVLARSVRVVLRDADWDTVELRVGRVSFDGAELMVPLRADGDLGAHAAGDLRVSVTESGSLRLAMRAGFGHEFATARMGLVMLHPPQLAGSDLRIEHDAGDATQTQFPVAISPHQPAFDIRSLSWPTADGEVTIAFEGDVFEMEDQRNWTDASYKTYSRPLSLPFPYEILRGQTVRQAIEITAPLSAPSEPADAVLHLERGGAFPRISTMASSEPDPLPALATVGRSLLVELDLDAPTWPAALERASEQGVPMDIRLVVSEASAAATVPALVEALVGHDVRSIAVFDDVRHVSLAPLQHVLESALATRHLSPVLVTGARSHFTELNRELAEIPERDALAFSSTPLFHAVGTQQLIESIPMQRLTVQQAVAYAGDRAVHVGPVTLRPRFNNVATRPQPRPTHDDLSEGYGTAFTAVPDARQHEAPTVAWTLASIAAFAVPGATDLFYFEQLGARGLARDANDGPLAELIADVAALPTGTVLWWAPSPDPLVWAIGAEHAGELRVMLANLDDRERTVTVEASGAHEATVPALGITTISIQL